MKVLLVDVDSTWANLALMKLSTAHKRMGDEVHLLRLGRNWRVGLGKPVRTDIKAPDTKYDKVYVSCIFTENRHLALQIAQMYETLGAEVEVGGSGVSLETKLPNHIEHLMPDYELYDLDYSMGFLTRGCIRNCPWCVVPKKEGKIKLWSPLKEFLHPSHRKVMLLDNNLLAHLEHPRLLMELIQNRLEVCFSQGLDIRLIDDENAKLLRLVRYRDTKFRVPRLYFAFDTPEIEDAVVKGVETLKKHGTPPSRLLFYMLCGFRVRRQDYTWDYFLEHDWHRFEVLAKLGCKPFVMKWNGRNDIPLLNAFARWVNFAHKAKKKPLDLMESFKSFLKHEYKWAR